MPRIAWSDAASRDLIRLYEFLAEKSREAGLRAVKVIRQEVKLLATHPEIGRPVEDMLPEYRELVIEFGRGAYLAMYHYDRQRVVVLAIRHGRETGY